MGNRETDREGPRLAELVRELSLPAEGGHLRARPERPGRRVDQPDPLGGGAVQLHHAPAGLHLPNPSHRGRPERLFHGLLVRLHQPGARGQGVHGDALHGEGQPGVRAPREGGVAAD